MKSTNKVLNIEQIKTHADYITMECPVKSCSIDPKSTTIAMMNPVANPDETTQSLIDEFFTFKHNRLLSIFLEHIFKVAEYLDLHI